MNSSTRDVLRIVAGVIRILLDESRTGRNCYQVTAYSIFADCLELGTDSLLAGCSRPDTQGLSVNFHTGFICVCVFV